MPAERLLIYLLQWQQHLLDLGIWGSGSGIKAGSSSVSVY